MREDELERELSRLTPAAPTQALLARLNEARGGLHKIVPFRRWLPLTVAACALVLLLLRPAISPPKPASSGPTLETFRAVETDRYLLSAHDLGVVELQPGRPYRLVHCVWADRETFRSENGASRLEVRQARQQIVPLALTAL